MKSKSYIGLIAVVLAMLGAGSANAAGLLIPQGQSSSLDIRDHKVNVVVDDGYVVTEIEQVFINAGGSDVEAVYSFPVPSHAAVAEFTYWIDGQPVVGEVLKKQEARDLYEQEKSQGRETALAEKDEYRTFDISVYPVRANSDVRIRLVYVQSAVTDTGIGRYVYPLEEGGVDEERKAFWEVRDAVTGSFSFDFELKSTYPVDAVRLPEQPNAALNKIDTGHWTVNLHSMGSSPADAEFAAQVEALEAGETPALSSTASGVANLDTDIVVYWRHAPDLPGSVDLVTYKPDASGRGTFMLTFTPGDDLPVIEEGRDWVFVLDTSGSMQGKFATLANGVQQALGKLNPNDRFRIFTFSDSARELTSGFIQADAAGVNQYAQSVGNLQSGGGTNLYAGLQAGLNGIDSDRTSGIALVTDGVANVGITQKKEFLKMMEKHDIRLFTFIMGNSANRPLLEAMTEVSNGFAMETSNSDDISGQLMLATAKIRHAALHDVSLKVDGLKVADLTPERIGSLYHGEQLKVLGHYWGSDEARVVLTGKVAGQDIEYKTRFPMPVQSDLNPELERIWAYATIENLQSKMDYFGADQDTEDAITDLAVEYGLVTDYTSMIVVREEVFAAQGIKRLNRDRVAAEHVARQARATQPPQNRRVDQNQPMYTKPRPSTGGGGSGGGAFGLPMLLGLFGLAWFRRRKEV
ncbi:MAG: VIT and VWA domain-containing protein [Gammaproteobacteria bacterium]|nr:VIT and VWA domain-containing protein [Gammaproteobacteria bacterium]